MEEFKPGDRVIRAEQIGSDAKGATKGPMGVVQKIRVESQRNSIREDGHNEGPGVAVTVLWDNGTVSHFVPEGLAKC
jgi:hypothetical protein